MMTNPRRAPLSGRNFPPGTELYRSGTGRPSTQGQNFGLHPGVEAEGRLRSGNYGMSTISWPSGVRATGIILKLAMPNGIPMIVRHRPIPVTR